MSILRLLLISSVTFLVSLFFNELLQTPVSETHYESSKRLANKDKAYRFEVPENGQMMRFEIAGSMPMNTWKSIDIDVYDLAGNYLFTYQDELWSESGRDSEGKWTEYRRYAEFSQHFPKKGIYEAYVSDSSGPRSKIRSNDFRIRAVPIRGNNSFIKPVLWISGAIALMCLVIIGNRMEENKHTKYRPRKSPSLQQKNDKSVVLIVLAIFLAPTVLLTAMAFQKDDDDVNWLHVSHRSKKMTVDRELRQQSLSGAEFRTGGSRGGK